jgi:hypothetical protein
MAKLTPKKSSTSKATRPAPTAKATVITKPTTTLASARSAKVTAVPAVTPVKATLKKPATATKAEPRKDALRKPVSAKTSEMKVEKVPKLKMERDSFTMPKAEYAQLAVLKERLSTLGHLAKKSELLRAGIMCLTSLSDAALKTALSKVPTIKTGRPKKK